MEDVTLFNNQKEEDHFSQSSSSTGIVAEGVGNGSSRSLAFIKLFFASREEVDFVIKASPGMFVARRGIRQ